ncbi:HNH endonuclease, partial [Streptococcus pseudopneumoniae]|uniref:HNH endonuclease n=1 Tax=Streptococcus pseudopneumoniae TaxID=257758 RepID=UPI001BB24F85
SSDLIELLITYMDEQVKYKKSVKAQRALMTKKLREYVKERDCYTCQYCGASTAQQDLLLLEVDHIIPVSKGGMSTESNLQTLCWKCNRTKSDKIL